MARCGGKESISINNNGGENGINGNEIISAKISDEMAKYQR